MSDEMVIGEGDVGSLATVGYSQDCGATLADGSACPGVMEFEKHPADWPNHPGDPGVVRVAIECPVCGTKHYTDGGTEVEFQKRMNAAVDAEIRAEVARRLNAEAGGEVAVVEVSGADGGGGADHAAAPGGGTDDGA